MITLFECWNGGCVQWNQNNPPQFCFGFPPQTLVLIKFFQISGRVCEILTQRDWILNIGGQLFDIPNFPQEEIDSIVTSIRNNMGYTSQAVPCQLGNPFGGFFTIPIALWVNLITGRADMYNPFVGFVIGQQLLLPNINFNPLVPSSNFQVNLLQSGKIEGQGSETTLQSIAKIAGTVGKIIDFINKLN